MLSRSRRLGGASPAAAALHPIEFWKRATCFQERFQAACDVVLGCHWALTHIAMRPFGFTLKAHLKKKCGVPRHFAALIRKSIFLRTSMCNSAFTAVYHATGKRIRDLPITPDKLI
jgi:hypothetical protein